MEIEKKNRIVLLAIFAACLVALILFFIEQDRDDTVPQLSSRITFDNNGKPSKENESSLGGKENDRSQATEEERFSYGDYAFSTQDIYAASNLKFPSLSKLNKGELYKHYYEIIQKENLSATDKFQVSKILNFCSRAHFENEFEIAGYQHPISTEMESEFLYRRHVCEGLDSELNVEAAALSELADAWLEEAASDGDDISILSAYFNSGSVVEPRESHALIVKALSAIGSDQSRVGDLEDVLMEVNTYYVEVLLPLEQQGLRSTEGPSDIAAWQIMSCKHSKICDASTQMALYSIEYLPAELEQIAARADEIENAILENRTDGTINLESNLN